MPISRYIVAAVVRASGRNARRPCDEANAAQVSATKERGDCGVEVVESVDYLGAVKLELSLASRGSSPDARPRIVSSSRSYRRAPALRSLPEQARFGSPPESAHGRRRCHRRDFDVPLR